MSYYPYYGYATDRGGRVSTSPNPISSVWEITSGIGAGIRDLGANARVSLPKLPSISNKQQGLSEWASGFTFGIPNFVWLLGAALGVAAVSWDLFFGTKDWLWRRSHR